MRKPCIICGTPTQGTRCRSCPPARPGYGNTERLRRKQAVDAHRAEYGNWCPGWQRAPHPATDLTADHITAVAVGGAENGPLSVLCRSCNSRKGAQC